MGFVCCFFVITQGIGKLGCPSNKFHPSLAEGHSQGSTPQYFRLAPRKGLKENPQAENDWCQQKAAAHLFQLPVPREDGRTPTISAVAQCSPVQPSSDSSPQKKGFLSEITYSIFLVLKKRPSLFSCMVSLSFVLFSSAESCFTTLCPL